MRMRVGVRRDERRVGERGDVPKTLLVQVRQVDEDLQLVADVDQRLALVGQAGAGVRRAREAERDAVPENVRPAPDQPERAQAGLVQHLQHLEVAVDRLGALEVQHGRHARRHRSPARISDALRQTRTAPSERRAMRKSSETICSATACACVSSAGGKRHVVFGRLHHVVAVVVRLERGHEDGEEAADEAAGPRARQIEMAGAVAIQERSGAAVRLGLAHRGGGARRCARRRSESSGDQCGWQEGRAIASPQRRGDHWPAAASGSEHMALRPHRDPAIHLAR